MISALHLLIRIWAGDLTKLHALKQLICWLEWAHFELMDACYLPGSTATDQRWRVTNVQKAIRNMPPLAFHFKIASELTLKDLPSSLTANERKILKDHVKEALLFQAWLARVESDADVKRIKDEFSSLSYEIMVK